MTGVIDFEFDFVLTEAIQPAMKSSLPVNWSRGPEPNPAAREPLVIRRLIKRPLDARRRDFENICRWNKILDVDKRFDLFANVLAIAVRHAAGFIDIYSEQQTSWRTDQVPVDQLEVLSLGYALNEVVQDLSVNTNH